MKKILFSAAILAAVASCSKTEVTETYNSEEIKFSTLNDRTTTRTPTDAEADNYKLYATTGIHSSATAWFIKDVTTSVGNGTTADVLANAPYYYPAATADGAVTVNFFAYAPAVSDGVQSSTLVETCPGVAFDYVVSGKEDLTIATASQTSGDVALTFAHQLAKVTIDVDVDSDLEGAGYYISSVGDITFGTQTSAFSLGVVAGTQATVSSSTTDKAADYTNDRNTDFYIAPQTSTGCTVTVKDVVILANDGSPLFSGDLNAYTIAASDVTGDLFVKGSYYKIAIEVSSATKDGDGNPIVGDEIKFTCTPDVWDSVDITAVGDDNQL